MRYTAAPFNQRLCIVDPAMGLRHYWKQRRNTLVRHELGNLADAVPERYLAGFACVGGAAEHVYVLGKLLPPSPRRVLIVGVFGGRDFWGLRTRGYDVVGMDLDAVEDCPPTFRGDAEDRWPFKDAEFDIVIIGEVLEHLIRDSEALLEAKRVLSADGLLIVTVPYLHDSVEYHVRVHTPPTIRRLLETTGFKVHDCLERPAIMSWRWVNWINQAVGLGVHLLTGRNVYPYLNQACGAIEWRLGHWRWIPRRWLCMLGLANWGGTIAARPIDRTLDYKALNSATFTAASSTVI